jgi:hypothetical protein
VTRGSLIGCQINEKSCQISYYNAKESEPQTLEVDDEHNFIPLCIGKIRDTWLIGKDAQRLLKVKERFAVTRLLERGLAGERFEYEGELYEAVWLLSKFMQMVLEPFRDDIEGIVFSVPELSEDLANLLRTVAVRTNIAKQNIFIQDYKESFCNYLFYQSKDLWQYESALFHCDQTEIKAYVMRRLMQGIGDGKTTFVTVDEFVSTQMGGSSFIYPVIDSEKGREADLQYSKFVDKVFQKRIISSVFLTGEGFAAEWFPNSLRTICLGRRAFMGNNLYSKGACYAAYRKLHMHEEDPVYLSENKLSDKITISMRVEGQDMAYPIVSWGSRWYESNNQWDVLLKEVKDIELHIESLLDGTFRTEIISLEGFPRRTEYSMRLQIETLFLNENTCKITMKDVGFGEFFAPTDFKVERIIQLGGADEQFNPMP